MSVYRIYAEKKKEFAVEAQSVLNDSKTALRINITNVKYHLNSDSQRIQTEESLVERFTTSLKRVFGRRK